MATWGQLGFSDRNSPLIEELTFFHDHTLIIIALITALVGYIISIIFTNKFSDKYYLADQNLEFLWTAVPVFTLISVGLPSLRLLYLLDEIQQPALTIKIIGHQWYWTYQFNDFVRKNDEINSYIIPTNELREGDFRLLETDNRLVLPNITHIRLIITAADVVHSWTVPSLGIKIDAFPGRLNQIHIFVNRVGLYYGQCSEICGINHSFIPISIEITQIKNFFNWQK